MNLFSKTHQSSLTLKGGSTSHLGLLPSGKKRKPPYSVLKPLRYKVGGPSEVSPAAELRFAVCDRMDPNRLRAAWCLLEAFSKTHQSSLTLKGGSTSHLGLLPSGKKRKPLLLVARNHFILWLADHQRSRQQRSCGFLCGDKPAFTQGLA